MSSTNKKIIGFRMVSAMRGSFGIGILGHYLSRTQSIALQQSRLGFIQSPLTVGIIKLLCAGEVAGDKLPAASNRIGFPQILRRIASGATLIKDKEGLTPAAGCK